MKRVLLFCVVLGACMQPSVQAKRLYVNDLKAPESKDDVLAIQGALMEHLERTRAATVCVKLDQGSGTGVIVSEDGLVLTAAHVSGGVNKKLKVMMEDGSEYEAVSLGLNANNDAAMMQIVSEKKFPFVEIESETEDARPRTQLGDWVYSLGHSGGFDKARGSVVRLGRMVRVTNETVRTDCLLIGGDSGGPLFDLNGVLIGIHSRVGGHASQNMHVPAQVFRKHWRALKESKFIGDGPFATKPKPGSGIMGVAITEVDEGLKLTEVEPEYPADVAGLKVGDVLISVNGESVKSKSDLKKLMQKRAAGDILKVNYLREGGEGQVELTLVAR